jgi:hypothetical protein
MRSDTPPHIGAKRSSVNAEVATSRPSSLPLAPSFSMRKGKMGMIIPYPNMTTAREKDKMPIPLR